MSTFRSFISITISLLCSFSLIGQSNTKSENNNQLKQIHKLNTQNCKDTLSSTIKGEEFYNIAIQKAQDNLVTESVYHLKEAVKLGFNAPYYEQIKFSNHFNSIKHTSTWKEFLNDLQSLFTQEVQYPHYRYELLKLYQEEQEYRGMIINGRIANEVSSVIEATDRYHVMRLEKIIDEIGWPTYTKVGKDGAHAAWSIAQHAVFNMPFMKACLQLMQSYLHKNEIDEVDYAYLYDRFHTNGDLQKQRYGILFDLPIEQEHLVEERRAKMGFSISLAEYTQKASYKVPTQEEVKKHNDSLQIAYIKNIKNAKKLLEEDNHRQASIFYSKALGCLGYIKTEDIYDAMKTYALCRNQRFDFEAIKLLRCLSARGFNDITLLENEEAFKFSLQKNKLWQETIMVIKKYNSN